MAQGKNYINEYLSFTRKERVGIISIFVLILLCIILPFLFPFFITTKPADHTAFEKEIAALKLKAPDSGKTFTKRNYEDDTESNYNQPSEKNYYSIQPKGELFYFDPNTLSVDGWQKLGVREKTATTIQKYIAKGGRFYKPEDIAKIWGLHKEEVNRLMPYVKIETSTTANLNTAKTPEKYKPYERPTYTMAPVNINAADTSALIALPGIGSKLAARIIAFRDKLGGFYKVEQVAETYALPDSTFQKIKDKLVVTNIEIKKLNINVATLDELKIHPYIRYNIANAIVQYRTQHGSFASVNDIKKIMMITDEILNKVAPYLMVR